MSKRTLFTVLGVAAILSVLVSGFLWLGPRPPKIDYSQSCAKHFNYFFMRIPYLGEMEPEFVCPSTDDTGEALRSMLPGLRGDGNLYRYWNSCPESFITRGELGYVYVGDGLRLADAVERGLPILMCPAENHQQSKDEYCRAFPHPKGWLRSNNAGMIKFLRRTIIGAESGKYPYSKRAVAVLKSELRKRESFEASR